MHKDIIKEIHTLNEKLLEKNIFKGGKGFYQLLDEKPNVNKRNVFFCLSMEEGKKYVIEFAPPNLNHIQLQKYLRRALFLLILDPRRNVVSARDFSIDPNQGFVILDWIAGMDLHTILRKSSIITVKEALWILSDLTKALEHLADFSFVHRNIHPRSIIIRKTTADIYLSGLEYLAQSDFMETKLVDINTHYISPELMRSLIFPDKNVYITPASDIYSIGAIFFHMLTGTPPFNPKRDAEKWSARRYRIPKLEDVRADRKQRKMLQFLVKKMMDFDPNKRWSTMEIRDYVYDCLGITDRDKDMQRFLQKVVMEQIQALPKLPPRKKNAHKGSCGKAFIVAGSRGMMGAAYLTTESTLRSGTGLVTLATAESEQRVAATKLTCAMTYPLPATSTGSISFEASDAIVDITRECQAVAVGPGMSQHPYTQQLVCDILPRLNAPIVVDADALNALQTRSDVLQKRNATTIITPHPGEFSRLVGKPISEVVENAKEIATQFAQQNNCVVVLKVAPAIVVSSDSYYGNTTGNPGMATGGSGDVLTGVITALLAQGFAPFSAAQLGVYLHGMAGDLCKEYIGEYGMIASDILQFLPHAFQIHLSQEQIVEYYLSDKEFMHAAIQGKYLTAEQVAKCKQSQKNVPKHKDKMLHELALYHNLMSVEQLDRLYKETRKKNKALSIGNYEIKSILGEGGLGVVYLAKQLSMKRNVALKVLYRKWVQDEEFRKRFLLEARIVGKLSHTNLIQVFDIGYDKGHYYFSMEYVPGSTLEQIIIKDDYIPLEKAMDHTLQLLDALNYIWKKNLVHRDIKPSNIIINKEQTAKLGDFGFVKSKMDEQLVQNDDFVLGTPDYMSPEQAMGKNDLDYRSDIYSLGATFYHMITGSAPYDGSESVIIRQHIKAAIPSPVSIRGSIPPGVCQIIEKMMAKEPQDRYQSYESLQRDLLLVKEGSSPKAERLDINKSTIARQDFFGLPAQIYKLEEEIKRLKYREIYYQILIVILCSTLVIILLLAG